MTPMSSGLLPGTLELLILKGDLPAAPARLRGAAPHPSDLGARRWTCRRARSIRRSIASSTRD